MPERTPSSLQRPRPSRRAGVGAALAVLQRFLLAALAMLVCAVVVGPGPGAATLSFSTSQRLIEATPTESEDATCALDPNADEADEESSLRDDDDGDDPAPCDLAPAFAIELERASRASRLPRAVPMAEPAHLLASALHARGPPAA